MNRVVDSTVKHLEPNRKKRFYNPPPTVEELEAQKQADEERRKKRQEHIARRDREHQQLMKAVKSVSHLPRRLLITRCMKKWDKLRSSFDTDSISSAGPKIVRSLSNDCLRCLLATGRPSRAIY